MIVALVVAAIGLLAGALVVAVAREPGPTPVDVAVAYELAWDRLDFDGLWGMSTRELRDGRGRKDFVAAKAAAYEGQSSLGGLIERVGVERVAGAGRRAATVLTSLDLRDGSRARNEVRLLRRHGAWHVAGYALAAEPADAAGST